MERPPVLSALKRTIEHRVVPGDELAIVDTLFVTRQYKPSVAADACVRFDPLSTNHKFE